MKRLLIAVRPPYLSAPNQNVQTSSHICPVYEKTGHFETTLESVPKTKTNGDPPTARPNDRQRPDRPRPRRSRWWCARRPPLRFRLRWSRILRYGPRGHRSPRGRFRLPNLSGLDDHLGTPLAYNSVKVPLTGDDRQP